MYSVRQKNTKYAKQNTKYAKQNTKYANQNAKYAKQNTKCANSIKRVCQTNNYWFTLFCRDAIFVANLRTFWRTFYRPNKYGGVRKMTNMRYASSLEKHWPRFSLQPLQLMMLNQPRLSNANEGQCA